LTKEVRQLSTLAAIKRDDNDQRRVLLLGALFDMKGI
jgi:hypothetical protein